MEVCSLSNTLDDLDEEELPDLINISDIVPKKSEFMPGDIVWAKYRQLYWPSLVRSVCKKQNKIRVWYLDSPQKCFTLPFKKVKSFSDPEISVDIKKEVENSPMKVLHRKVYFNAITYIRRKAEGYKDDPAAYFDLNKHYLAFQKANISEHSSSDTNIESNAEEEAFSDHVSDDEQSLSDTEDDETFGIERKISKFMDLDDPNEDHEKSNAIVAFIKAGKVDRYLNQIKSKKVPSEYHNFYEDAMKTDRTKLFHVTACDIVTNRSKLREISIYLMDLYEKTVEGGKCEMIDYITSVWLPEAINKAAKMIEEGKSSSSDSKTIKRKLFSADEEPIKSSKTLSKNGKTRKTKRKGK